MDRNTLDHIRRIVYEQGGIFLGKHKEALVTARLGRRMRALGMTDCREYLSELLRDVSGREIVSLLNVISTNVTDFFREPDHFEFLNNVVRRGLNKGQRRFRFWSAACSRGQEPYSLAMSLLETLDGADVDLKILATDISTDVLQACAAGIYSKQDMRSVPEVYRARYFDESTAGGEHRYVVARELRALLVVTRINLSVPPFTLPGPLDAILCRNVMIYFDTAVRERLIRELHRLLKPGGYLILGHSENLPAGKGFAPVQPSVYVKRSVRIPPAPALPAAALITPRIASPAIRVVGPGDMAVSHSEQEVLVTYSLGTCVGLSVYDPVARLGGLIHTILPMYMDILVSPDERMGRFTNTGVVTLLEAMIQRGARKNRLIVKAAGAGSRNPGADPFGIGRKNYTILRKVLWKNDMLLAGEDVGGIRARTMRLYMSTGETTIESAGEEKAL